MKLHRLAFHNLSSINVAGYIPRWQICSCLYSKPVDIVIFFIRDHLLYIVSNIYLPCLIQIELSCGQRPFNIQKPTALQKSIIKDPCLFVVKSIILFLGIQISSIWSVNKSVWSPTLALVSPHIKIRSAWLAKSNWAVRCEKKTHQHLCRGASCQRGGGGGE